MYKKVLSVILGAALMAGTLAGCGNSGKEAAATTAAAAETAKTEAAAPVSFDGTWPSTAVTLVVPAGAGGGTDLLSRVFAEKLSQKLGQTFVVSNVTGAGGSNGINQVHEADPDGNTILFFHNAMLINKVTGVSDYSYDGLKAGPHVVSDKATGFYVRSDAPYQTYPELIEYCNE